MLDMDEPHEVIAASAHVAAAKVSFAEQVGALVGEMVPNRLPVSALDHRAEAIRSVIVGLFEDAKPLFVEDAHAAHGRAENTTNALDSADGAGAARIQRTELI